MVLGLGRRTRRVSTMVLTGLLAGCVGCASAAGDSAPGGDTTSGSGGAAPAAQGLQDDYEQVVAAALPSIVRIDTSVGLGSGIILDTSGDVVTNAHVVGTATTFTVTLSTDSSALPARLVASFPQGDLAVIRLDSPPAGLKAAVFADSSALRIGQIVLAMGNPLGLSSSVTEGIVSATGRTVTEPADGGGRGAILTDMVQTSAAINPGNSGGALVDLAGQIVGIPTLAAVDPEVGGAAPGIGFAISANTAKDIAGQIVRDGKVTDSGLAALGLTGRTVLGDGFKAVGVGVVSVDAGGPAAKAGIAAGDLVTLVDGTATPDTAALAEALAALKPGQRVPVVVTRASGSSETLSVTLGTLAVG
jgi:putative serine protease PepD